MERERRVGSRQCSCARLNTLHSRTNSRAAKTCVKSSAFHGRKRRGMREGKGEELKNSHRVQDRSE